MDGSRVSGRKERTDRWTDRWTDGRGRGRIKWQEKFISPIVVNYLYKTI